MRISTVSQAPHWNTITRTACVIVVVVACLVLVGWLLDIELFKRLAPSLVAMNPVAAVGFILTATALWLLSASYANAALPRRGRGLALLVIVIAVLKLADIVFGWQIDIDRLLFTSKLDITSTGIPNRMAPNTAINFLVFGAALWFLDWRRSRWLSLALTLAGGMLALLALVGYAYDMNAFYSIAAFIPMALHTAAAFVVLTLGILAARPESPLMAVVTSDTVAGITARRLLPVVILAPTVLGWIFLTGVRLQLYPLEAGIAFFTVALVLIFLAVVWRTVRTLLRIEIARKAAEAKIQTLNDDLIAANKELEAFSYSVSHDLRAPLRAVNGFSRILLNDYSEELSEEAARYLNLVNANAAQMGRLIDDLLAFSRLSRQPVKRQQLALAPLVEQVFAELRDPADARAIELVVGAMPPIEADPALIKQVFVNLIGNALKYSGKREQARIEVGCEQQNGAQVYFVKDNGIGFDMKYVDKLFAVFQRLHRSEDFEGTGVGLATTQRIIHRHGGRIWAQAEVDQGASFYFTVGESHGENVP